MKLSSSGRGSGYSKKRGLVESALSLLYRRSWPARLWEQVPGACDVAVVRRRVRAARGDRPELRLGFASDLHIGPTTPDRLLDAAADALSAEDLDVLLLGGDYVFLDATEAKASRLVSFVRRVRARTKLAVLGNHDLWTTHGPIERALEGAGATIIVNRHVRLPPPHDDVAVVGLDDPWTGRPDADRAFRGTEDASVRVVLCHSPDALPVVKGRGVGLYVCGHTHGGHVAAPWGPIVVPGRVGKRMPAGSYDEDGTHVFVSRGIGGIELPVRTFARPDVAVLTMTT